MAWVLRRLIPVALITAPFPMATGAIYVGNITETVTGVSGPGANNPNGPGYFVGQTFTGSYQYESPTVDGDFGWGMYPYVTNPDALGTLKFNLFGFFGGGGPGGGVWLTENTSNYSAVNHLTITNGQVSDFFMTGQYGGADPNFRLTQFYVSDAVEYFNGQPVNTYTVGTMAFSDPVAITEPSTYTTILGAVTFCFMAIRRRKVA